MKLSKVGRSVSYWCIKPSRQQRIISGLRENFTKRYTFKKTNKAERARKQSCLENLWNEIQFKGP